MTNTTTRDQEVESALRGFSAHDQPILEGLLEMQIQSIQASGLDPKTHALTRIAVLVAMDAAPASFVWQVENALEAGATSDEILGVLIAVGPLVGTARVVAAAPELAFALGLNVDQEAQ